MTTKPSPRPRSAAASNAAQAAADGPSEAELLGRPPAGWRRRLYVLIFEADTPAGRAFDIALIAVILASVAVVMLDSVQPIARRWETALTALEWFFTGLFTLEYIARLVSVQRPWRYMRSFYGVIDLLALLPTLLIAIEPSLAHLIDVRILRLLRIFRIFKLTHYAAEYRSLGDALHASRRKIVVFLGFVVMVVLITGTLMYVIEGDGNAFTSIPVSIYWAISTMTTVGFGDIVPKTDLGRLIASLMMLVGWGILAVPTGIVTAEIARQHGNPDGASALLQNAAAVVVADEPKAATDRPCPSCCAAGHASDAVFCRRCAAPLA